MMIDDFNIYNGWLILHDEDRGEDCLAIRISDIQSISFQETIRGGNSSGPKIDRVSYKLAEWDYAPR